MVTISMPPNANATTNSPAAMPETPFGAKPPSPVKLIQPTGSDDGSRPKISSPPITRKPTITAIFTAANQNSNSPKLATRARLTAAKNTIAINAGIQGSTPNQRPMNAAAPVISAPITMMSVNQYSQPIAKPAVRPNAISAYVENDPDDGDAAAISPSMRMTRTTSRPASA